MGYQWISIDSNLVEFCKQAIIYLPRNMYVEKGGKGSIPAPAPVAGLLARQLFPK